MPRLSRDRLPATEPDPDEYLRLPAIARQLHIGQRKLRAEIQAGRLIAVDLASRGSRRPQYGVRRRDLDAWLESRRIMSVPPPESRPIRRRRPPATKQYV
jgi:hypothetical protein